MVVHPRLFEIGRLSFTTYGAVLACGILAALAFAADGARRLRLPEDRVLRLCLVGTAAAILAQRVLDAMLAWGNLGMPAALWSLARAPGAGSSLPSTAAAALAFLAVFLAGARRARLPLLRAADAIAPSLALVASAASVACLEAGCDSGLPTTLPWGLTFTSPLLPPGVPRGIPLHPVQAYASAAEFLIFLALLLRLRAFRREGEVFGAGLFLIGLLDGLLTPLRADAGPALFAGALSIGQTIDIVMVLAGAAFWLTRARDGQAGHAG
jgi:phosphatidylglycerol:prolipoprotein diacylglycerol transferase